MTRTVTAVWVNLQQLADNHCLPGIYKYLFASAFSKLGTSIWQGISMPACAYMF